MLKHLGLLRCKVTHYSCSTYFFEILDEPSSFDTTLHVEADINFNFCEGVGQLDDGNLSTQHTVRGSGNVELKDFNKKNADYR